MILMHQDSPNALLYRHGLLYGLNVSSPAEEKIQNESIHTQEIALTCKKVFAGR